MAKRTATKVGSNRNKNNSTAPKEEAIEADTSTTSEAPYEEGTTASEATSPQSPSDGVTLVETKRKRKKRQQKPATTSTLGEEAAQTAIGFLNAIGMMVSDEGALQAHEVFLISQAVAHLPQSEKLNQAMEKLWPVVGVAGLGMWAYRVMTHRRKPEVEEVQPVVNPTNPQPSATLFDTYGDAQ